MGRKIVCLRHELVWIDLTLDTSSRPKTIDEVSAQEHTIAVLRKTLTSTNVYSEYLSYLLVLIDDLYKLPHMLFYGPPGTGKTSTILALARQLFGQVMHVLLFKHLFTKNLRPDNFRNRVLELNASDERGIAIVRDKIKNFARQTPRAQAVASDGKTYPCPPYKIIILDEADSMTQDAQGALRRIMETFARITRFCLVCNYVTRFAIPHSIYPILYLKVVTRIIEPLASRCSKFRFTPLDSESASSRLSQIAQAENISIDQSVLDALIGTSSGDLRRAITYLQSASRLSSSSVPSTPIRAADIQEIAGVVPDVVINEFARTIGIEVEDAMEIDDAAKRKQVGFEPIRNKVKFLMREGYSASQILSQVRRMIFQLIAVLIAALLVARRGCLPFHTGCTTKICLCTRICRGG